MPHDLLILTGGAWHDFAGFSSWATTLLRETGYHVRCATDNDTLLHLGNDHPRCIVSYTSLGGAVDTVGRVGTDLSDAQVDALRTWVSSGGGLVAAHCATVASESKTPYHALVGGRFLTHPEQHTFRLYPSATPHPIIDGIPSFDVFDELYIQDVHPGLDVHMVTVYQDNYHPMVWSRTEGLGRVVHVAPGHSDRVWQLPEFGRLFLQATAWACG